MQRTLAGEWTVTASGRPSYEVMEASSLVVLQIVTELATRGYAIVTPPAYGLDSLVASVRKDGDGALVHVGWDIWSGVFVYADSADGDAVTRDIATWLAGALPALGGTPANLRER